MSDMSQDLRCQIVLKCLDVFRDVDAALHAAERVEHYLRHGRGQGAAVSEDSRRPGAASMQPVQRAESVSVPKPEASAAPDSAATPGPVVARSVPVGSAPVAGREQQGSATEDRPKLRQGSGPKRRWNPEDERILREMWEKGEETSAIAETLQRTPASVRERARALSLVRRKAESSPRRDRQAACTPLRKAATAHRGRRAYRRNGGVQPKDDGPSIHDIEAYRIRRPADTLETVVNFVRSRDYSVTTPESGEIVVDGHRHMSKEEFISWANSLRRHLNKSEFPLNLPTQPPAPPATSTQAGRR